MKFFWQKDGLPKPSIDKNYKSWIDDNVHWLVFLLGRPYRESFQYSLNRKDFPRTFDCQEISPLSLLGDLGEILSIPKNAIHFQWVDNLAEHTTNPVVEAGDLESWMKVSFNKDGFPAYEIFLSSNLKDKPGRILYCLIDECLRIVMFRIKGWPEAFIDNPLFLYLMGTYLGLGLIMAHQLEKSKIDSDGLWVQNWVYTSTMPAEAFAYSLALVAYIMVGSQSIWIKDLPPNILSEFKICRSYITKHQPAYAKENSSLPQEKLFHFLEKASRLYKLKQFESAIETAYMASKHASSGVELGQTYNNIGYYKLRLGLYESAIPDFARAQKEDPTSAYAFDNMGFAYVMMGDLETGKKHIDKAISMDTNHMSYSYRNLGIYYQGLGDNTKAEECFLAAIASNLEVDLLYYLYGKFLWSQKQPEKAKYCFEIEAQNGEPEGIAALAKYFPEDNNE